MGIYDSIIKDAQSAIDFNEFEKFKLQSQKSNRELSAVSSLDMVSYLHEICMREFDSQLLLDGHTADLLADPVCQVNEGHW
jgi:predicted metal-dependent HD superfamily phosphohydrolase